jgi:hypothetical protein
MKSSRSLIAITVATTLALIPSAIAAPKTTSKAAGRVTTTVVNTILSGSGVPSKTLGINGDFYIDTKNLNLYGPKTKGVWKVATSLKQTDTKSVTTVIGETGSTGEKGDKGDKGATGSTGATGSAGVAGVAGAKGSDGAVGASGATGLAGSNGATGPSGSNGSAGAAGSTGPAGASGGQGIQGVKGDTGNVGATGAAGVSVSKFVSIPSISLITATESNSNSETFFIADADGNYTFDILLAGVVQIGVEYKMNAEIISGTSAILAQYVIASDALSFTNGLAGRQYGFHIIGVAGGVTSGTVFGVRISIQYGAGTSTVYFNGRALINKVGSIG